MTTAPTQPEVHLMLDIETMGSTPGAAILSIGAVFFQDLASTPEWAKGMPLLAEGKTVPFYMK